MIRVIFRTFVFVLLTVLTQIGGVAYLIALTIAKRNRLEIAVSRFFVFLGVYGVLTISMIFIAPAFGRVSLPCFGKGNLVSQSPAYCALNRQYVTPDMRRLAEGLADHMATKYPGTKTLTLDANFPFFNGFPLLPHLSHDDGEKLDLAFYYQSEGGYLPGETRSSVGYWAFEDPRDGDPEPCEGTSGPTLRWDVPWFQIFHREMMLEPDRTREALRWLSDEGAERGIRKIFVEPHLQSRLGVQAETIRFQGCRAARHDDHIHIQL